jgi:hypothetical protein
MVENAWGNNLDRFVNQKQKQREPFDILFRHLKAPHRLSLPRSTWVQAEYQSQDY